MCNMLYPRWLNIIAQYFILPIGYIQVHMLSDSHAAYVAIAYPYV
jgi:hypothetical protein